MFSRKVADLFVRFLGSRNSFRLSYEAIPEDDHRICCVSLAEPFFEKIADLLVRILGSRNSFRFCHMNRFAT